MIGQVIDKYRVESDLDKEPFGVVYKATDLQTQQVVELGIIDPSLTEYGNDLKEVLDHKQIISGIAHQNIAKLLDFFIFEENYVLVREHIPSAQSLSKWISSNSHSIEEIGEVVFQVCDALQYANEQGVAYNYISPSIIKIDKDGNVKITNLGFSKLFRASYSGSDTIIESANFLSPEQIQELPADGRSDVYSLGILLYLLLTKTLPFPGKNFAKIIAQKITEVPESPEQVNPRVPKMLSEVVMQALQPERESRFSDLGEFKERLATALKQSKRGATGRHVGQKFGNYEVTEILGHGAHSTVFKAIALESNNLVALKMLDFRLSMEDQFVKRFEREGIISEKLNHPNIVRIVEKFEHEEFFFLAIEYVDGVPLDKLFENDEPLPFEKAYKIFKQICEAFAYVHTQGIVHRDIKPSNIMINPEGKIKILDFGIAKILDAASESLTKSPIGTPQYMSPEQCSTGEVDSRTDIYALGVLLYKMVAGKVPFESDKLHILLKKHITEKPAPPSSINPAIPDELDKVILKALRKEKEKRFSNAEEMLAAFSTTMKPLMRTSYIGKTIGDYEIMSVGKRRGGMAETFIGKHK
ncbi:MAG: serine/threonine protein kinase, partial [Candidatus Abyssubacteria bacterium]|nr:serine/threonine protein kinase [Candidatus Abyssubacteria bacterium]